MYFPQAPKEPSGCVQSLIISRAIFAILAVPLGIILLAIFAVGFTFYLYTMNPLLGLIPLAIGGLVIWGIARWERARIAKEHPPDDQ